MKKKTVLAAALISLAWNLYLVIAATLNVTSLLPRIAGGQYHSLPMALRFVYAIQGIIVVFQIFFIIQLYIRNGAWSKNSYLLARIFLLLAGISAFVNFASRSPAERWNALAAAIIAYAYFVLAEMKLRPRR